MENLTEKEWEELRYFIPKDLKLVYGKNYPDLEKALRQRRGSGDEGDELFFQALASYHQTGKISEDIVKKRERLNKHLAFL